ncbi:phenylacetate--CoA ligase family protein [Micromonospora sp. WMMD882]|uniref:phenylacetate--CoA ligase family protein n=1 Tax=Micromonospora sp. WMMD882 TaxID=3015151 RepID=UPI00248CE3B0|nr:phenylacetate--CoA ligase family protein [Micromonospora sp. WMMD882]WBB78070.1 phenylacetate--CoA ligase family protein [Micromonospora sp. WMMD882]
MTASETTLLSAPAVLAAAWREHAFAREQVPVFGDLAAPTGTTYEHFRDLVPVTRKPDYRTGFPTRVVARGADLAAPDVLMSHSSGTGGDRLTSVSRLYDLSARQETTMRTHPTFAALLSSISGQRVGRYAAPNCSDVECANPLTTIADRTLRDGTLVLPVAHDLFTTPERMVRQALSELQEYRPHWLYTDATHLSFLITRARAAGIDRFPGVRAVLLTYTRATATAKRIIRDFFGPSVPVVEVISMSELGWVAMECPRGRMHLNAESFLAELRADGDGPAGELMLTTVGDRLSPHLRYATGDMYSRYGDACPCGATSPSVRLEGRASEALHGVDGVVLWPRAVDEIVGAPDGMLAYRVHQDEAGDVEFSYLPMADGMPSDEPERIGAELANRLKGRQVRVRESGYLASQRSGKYISCTSAYLVGDPR